MPSKKTTKIISKITTKTKKLSLKQLVYDSKEKITTQIIENRHNKKNIDITHDYTISNETLNNYVTLDWEHCREISKLKNTIATYWNDKTLVRPLNALMTAKPGSGKSYFIKCLAEEMSDENVRAVTYNMACMQSIEDLSQPLEVVRNLKVNDKFPILFLDEFDSPNANFTLLLPLLWDSQLQFSHRNIQLGKIVIILAASKKNVKNLIKKSGEIRSEDIDETIEEDDKKLIDLFSRLNGPIIDIPELDKVSTSRNRRVDKVCLSISLLRKRFGSDLESVPWALLHFIANIKFHYEARSIAHLIDSIPYNDSLKKIIRIGKLQLPLTNVPELRKSSLARHIKTCDNYKEPEDIVNFWKDTIKCKSLVKFYESV